MLLLTFVSTLRPIPSPGKGVASIYLLLYLCYCLCDYIYMTLSHSLINTYLSNVIVY